MPNALIITTAGINCDLELGHAFELAGAQPQFLHLNRLMADPSLIEQFDLIGLPGGFSYGDAIAAGRIAAQLMRRSLYPAFVRAIERGVPICIWTQGITADPVTSLLPIAHGEGRFMVESEDLLNRLEERGQIAIRYAEDDNPNGSIANIAGICDASGLVFGLMPHPERFTRWTHHPFWSRLSESDRHGETLGLKMFRNAVAHVTERQHAAAR